MDLIVEHASTESYNARKNFNMAESFIPKPLISSSDVFDFDKSFEKPKPKQHESIPSNRHRNYSLESIEWTFACAISLISGNFETWKKLLTLLDEKVVFQIESSNLVTLCSDHISDGLKYYEALLKSTVFDKNLRSRFRTISDSIQYGAKFVQMSVKCLFEKSPRAKAVNRLDFEEFLADRNEKQEILKLLMKCEDEDLKIALRFAFEMGMEDEFQNLIEKRKWSDNELLYLIQQKPLPIPFLDSKERMLKLILKCLRSDAKISETDCTFFFEYLMKLEMIDSFQLLWEDERMIRSKESTNRFVLSEFSLLSRSDFFFLNFLTPYCSLSDATKFILNEKIETMQFRNVCMMLAIAQTQSPSFLSKLEELFQIKWNENSEFLDFILNICFISIDTFEDQLSCLFENTKIDWKKERIYSVFFKFCETIPNQSTTFATTLFENFFKQFRKQIDVSLNGNECLRKMLSQMKKENVHSKSRSIFKSIINSPSFKLKDENERKEFCQMFLNVEGIRTVADDLKKIKLIV